MSFITTPIKPNETSDNVSNLQQALLKILPLLGTSDFTIPDAELQAKTAGDATAKAVRMVQDKYSIPPSTDTLVDKPTADAINKLLQTIDQPGGGTGYIVKGFIRDEAGGAVRGIQVIAFDRDIRPPYQRLGQSVTTNEKGYYEIAYTANDFTDADDNSYATAGADIFIELYNVAGQLIFSSVDQYVQNAPAIYELNIDLTTQQYRGPSEFERYLTVIKPLLKTLSIDQLEETDSNKDVSFLHGETGIPSGHIQFLVLAHQFALAVPLAAELFYGWLREELPAVLAELLLRTTDDLLEKIKAAVAGNIIPLQTEAVFKTVQELLATLRKKYTLDFNITGDKKISDILNLVLPANLQENFISLYQQYPTDSATFWNKFAESLPPENKKMAADAKYTIQLAGVTGGNPALISVLRQNTSLPDYESLAKLEKDDLVVIIKNAIQNDPATMPADMPGTDIAEKITNYANAMSQVVAATIPTKVFSARLSKYGSNYNTFKNTQPDLLTFFNDNPDFVFGDTAVSTIITNPDGFHLSNVKDLKTLSKELLSIERLTNYTAKFEAIALMKDAGMDAAFHIVEKSSSEGFQTMMAGVISVQEAQDIYMQALQHKNLIQNLVVNFHGSQNSELGVLAGKTFGNPAPPPPPPKSPQSPQQNIIPANAPQQGAAEANFQNLFGTADTCACEDCVSVNSPAAYLYDLLHFLETQTGNQKLSPLFTALMQRRPDLQYLQLNCANTNTPLPYIDLVIELLENTIMGFQPGKMEDTYQTLETTEELLANPEHPDAGTSNRPGLQKVRDEVYMKLSGAKYPIQLLPFNLPLAETRVYLDHLGVSRNSLQELLFTGSKQDLYNDYATCIDLLGLGTTEAGIISLITPLSDGSVDSGLWNYYGFNKENNPANVYDPLDSSKLLTGNWINIVGSRVDIFLQQTGITYIELLFLLECRFLNPVTNGSFQMKIVPTADSVDENKQPIFTCDTSKLMIDQLDATALGKIYRFIHLYKKLGWQLCDLDKIITSLNITSLAEANAGVIDNGLKKIAQTERLSRMLPVPVIQLAVMWNDMDTADYIDYNDEQLTAISTLYDEVFRNKTVLHPLDPGFTENAVALTGKLSDHIPAVIAALQISEDDFKQMSSGPSKILSNDDLSLDNLSTLYRHTLLSKFTGIPLKDYLDLYALLPKQTNQQDPFRFSGPLSVLGFMEAVNTITGSGFTVEEINYYFQHQFTSNTTLVPDGEMISQVLTALRDDLHKIAPLIAGLQNDITILDATITRLGAIVNPTPQDQAALDEAKSQKLQKQDAAATIIIQRDNLVVQKLASALQAANGLAAVLLKNIIKNTTGSKQASISQFTDETYITSVGKIVSEPPANPNTAFYIPALFDVFIRLSKAVNLLKKLGIADDETELFYDLTIKSSAVDIGLLPVTATSFVYDEFLQLITLTASDRALPKGTPSAWLIQSAPSKKEWLSAFISRTNCKADQLTALVGDDNSSGILPFPAGSQDGSLIIKLVKCFSVIKRLGISVPAIAAAVAEPDFISTAVIKNATKAKYTEDEWLTVARPLRDKIREQQRAALVACLVANPVNNQWRDSNGLYSYLLIDIEMSACMITSRLKQAISSVQLFVDRVLLNLELDTKANKLLISEDQATQWKTWRKQYRVWEANRKIFLYPENWLEPELRDDKSPFFKELESQLLQAAITKDVVEDAYIGYLEKLDTVSQLEIIALYEDPTSGDPENTLYVFARTHADPHEFYFRKRRYNEWKTWEKIDVKIQDNSVTPAIWNGRLYLFWAEFTEKAVEGGTINVGGETTIVPVPKYLEVRIAWSEYKNGKWLGKKISENFLKTKPTYLEGELASYKELIYLTVVDKGNLIFYFIATNDNGLDGDYVVSFVNSGKKTYIFWNNGIKPEKNANQISSYASKAATSDSKFNLSSIGLSSSELLSWVSQFRAQHINLLDVLDRGFFVQDITNIFFVTSKRRLVGTIDDSPGISSTLANQALGDAVGISKTYHHLTANTGNSSSPAKAIPVNLVNAETNNFVSTTGNFTNTRFFQYYNHRHTHVQDFMQNLSKTGIPGFLNLEKQTLPDNIDFKKIYGPVYVDNKPEGIIDFDYNGGAYTVYNWELFFHIPLLMANRLSANQRFEEARQWYHYIFDPTTADPNPGKERFWKFFPFHEEAGTTMVTLQTLQQAAKDLELQVIVWNETPFNPHVIARLRKVAYMKNVVMKYLDNLMAWADQLFRQDTIETINEATQLYILCANILGNRPQKIPRINKPEVQCYDTLKQNAVNEDEFISQLVDIESIITPSLVNGVPVNVLGQLGQMKYFCVPPNDKMLNYWDIVADRLFKIRHCMNIEGLVQQLPLFEPPIDPALLVRAAAAGVDLSSVMADIHSLLPNQRFAVMIQKSLEICNDVRGLGSSLLSAFEKGDAEHLALLRSDHEIKMLNLSARIKDSQVEEADQNLKALLQQQATIQTRIDYYTGLIGTTALSLSLGDMPLGFTLQPDVGKLSSYETGHLSLTATALLGMASQASLQLTAGIFSLFPEVKFGSPTTAGTELGGRDLASSLSSFGSAIGIASSVLQTSASVSSTLGGYKRRNEEWIFQKNVAEAEKKQVVIQIEAAKIRVAISEKDKANLQVQIEQSQEAADFIQSGKFSNEELYGWMRGQLTTLYFQTYQLAFDVAKKAEKCFNYELSIDDAAQGAVPYIQFGYWDSAKKGLLAGEKLYYDLKKLELAYLDQNKRDFELTKNISIALLNPLALIELKETGKCVVTLPEELFDMDFPGHYNRRIKSVSISIPCITGPYSTINCTLRLLSNKYRYNTTGNNFRAGNIPVAKIATSSGQSDSGVFELNFRDERYLPFEGAGAVSQWSIELLYGDDNVKPFRQFDYDSISDVILHLKYTAREDTGPFRTTVIDNLNSLLQNAINNNSLSLIRMFTIQQEFPNEWYNFKSNNNVPLELIIDETRFPFFAQGRLANIFKIILFTDGAPGQNPPVMDIAVNNISTKSQLSVQPAMGALNQYQQEGLAIPLDKGPLTISITPPQEVTQCFLLLLYDMK